MIAKDLNVYKRAYKAAIDLNLFLEKEGADLLTEHQREVVYLSREVLGNIAEGFSQRTPRAKRFFNFKAADAVRRLLLSLDFLHDVQKMSDDTYRALYTEYEICLKQLFKLNQAILNPRQESIAPAAPVAVAA